MELLIYNTLLKRQVIFKPIDKEQIKMYVCGPTVYDHPHLGNARSIVVYDVLFRVLRRIYGEESVKYVRNITDVDDKIIDRARVLGISIEKLTTQTIEDFHQDTKYLNCLAPNEEPKATQHIEEMLAIIAKLIANNFAYVSKSGDVYFEVSKAQNYFALSNRTSEKAFLGSKIQDNLAKNNSEDFVLWKADDDIDCSFSSPWGKGRPGWHIECSAMSYKHLGENFDIHGGGADLIFPHHTNEIAQSIAAFPGSTFANYWIHNGFLTVNGEKMSKSLGNFITVKDLRDKKVSGEVVRLLLLSTHYRKPLDYNNKALEDAKKMLHYWYLAIEELELSINEYIEDNSFAPLLNDLNTPLAIKQINDLAKLIHAANSIKSKTKYAEQMLAQAHFLGLLQCSAEDWFQSDQSDQKKAEIEKIIAARNIAKKNKDWSQADLLRKQAKKLNALLIDKADGTTTWQKIKN